MAKVKYKWIDIPEGHQIIGPKFYKEIDDAIDKMSGFSIMLSGIARSGKSTLLNIIRGGLLRKMDSLRVMPTPGEGTPGELAWKDLMENSPNSSNLGWYGSALDIWNDYMDAIRTDYPDKAEAIERRKNRLCRPIILLDDLGLEATTTSGSDRAAPYIGKTMEAYCEWAKVAQLATNSKGKKVEVPKIAVVTTLITPAGRHEEGFETVTEGLREIYGARVAGRILDTFEIKIMPRKDFSELKQRCEEMK